jgi:hypothetical protein
MLPDLSSKGVVRGYKIRAVSGEAAHVKTNQAESFIDRVL